MRQAPAEAESISHQLLIRAGMIAQVATGVYSYLPLGWNVLRKIEAIIREEMNKAGGQEIMLPVLHPIELWEKSGRVSAFGQSLFRLIDRKEHSLVLGPTHEEVITDLVSKHVQSYRDLPILLYQIQTKFRDEPRSRGGLLRVREFIMKDLYSFDIDEQGLDNSYKKMVTAYQNVYNRLDLPVIMIEADSGAIGGKDSHEFMVLTDTGEDEILFCKQCGYAANREKAQFSKSGSVVNESQLAREKIATPDMKTIEAVATFLGVSTDHTIKAVFYMADSEFVFVLIRGDLEINEIKLKNVLKCNELRLATPEEVQEAGIVAGFASPVGISNIRTVADDSILIGNNFVAGANEVGYHYKNVNYERDFQVDLINDFALANAGCCCPKCRNKMSTAYGIEVGHIFKLGKFMSEKMGAYFLNSMVLMNLLQWAAMV